MNIERLRTSCTACGACKLLCPTQSITFKDNNEGFPYINVLKETCINCNLCERICPQHNNALIQPIKKSYAVIGKDKSLIRSSSSGGAFISIAEWVVQNQGIVFGTILNEDFKAIQTCAISKSELELMQGSKYVQSYTNDVYEKIAQSLLQFKYVLYVGTPCQVAGLYAYLGKHPENLYTIDIICHGVPSPKLFQSYIYWLEEKHAEIRSYTFRNKSIFDKSGFKCKYSSNHVTIKKDASLDPYYNSFLKGINFRECCYQCHYSKLDRIGDITIGDLDKAEIVCPDFFEWTAVSTCLLNNKKACDFWETVQHLFFYRSINVKLESQYNHQLERPSQRPIERDYFYKNYYNKEFFDILEAKCRSEHKTQLIVTIKKMVPIRLKYLIKKVLQNADKENKENIIS